MPAFVCMLSDYAFTFAVFASPRVFVRLTWKVVARFFSITLTVNFKFKITFTHCDQFHVFMLIVRFDLAPSCHLRELMLLYRSIMNRLMERHVNYIVI